MAMLDGKVGLVTGAGRGLGRACAMLLAKEGAKVVVAEIDRVTGEETARLISEAGGDAAFVQADIGQSAQVREMVRFAVDRFGKLDCAINNAIAFIPRAPMAEIADEEWSRLARTNIDGAFLCMKYEINAMLEGGGGAIVNIGSGRETTGEAGLSWYLGAKQAIYGMTKCAALDYGDRGIRINAVAPGPMWTPALRETAEKNPGHLDGHIARVPLRRIAEPEEVAEAAVWLCSDRASYVTGATLSADGGYVLG
ncbi:MAG: glucose 1-dehydrogenase [Novosphingobium sp.]|nr:glucose 1-dehydrogenase [Novosphingobium sp.]